LSDADELGFAEMGFAGVAIGLGEEAVGAGELWFKRLRAEAGLAAPVLVSAGGAGVGDEGGAEEEVLDPACNRSSRRRRI